MTASISSRDFEQLSAYLDGELDDSGRSELEKRLDREPALAETLLALRAQNEWLRGNLHTADPSDAVPPHIRALISGEQQNSSNVVHLAPRRGGYWRSRNLPRLAVAASLVAAVGLFALPRWQGGTEPANALSVALETLPSRASGWHTLEDGQRIRPLLSFPDRDGQWCREYLMADGEEYQHGVACRQADTRQWHSELSLAWQPSDESAAYRPAGAGDSRRVSDWIDAHAGDIPAGASQEAELIERRWQ